MCAHAIKGPHKHVTIGETTIKDDFQHMGQVTHGHFGPRIHMDRRATCSLRHLDNVLLLGMFRNHTRSGLFQDTLTVTFPALLVSVIPSSNKPLNS